MVRATESRWPCDDKPANQAPRNGPHSDHGARSTVFAVCP
jgi:hypothetical protein